MRFLEFSFNSSVFLCFTIASRSHLVDHFIVNITSYRTANTEIRISKSAAAAQKKSPKSEHRGKSTLFIYALHGCMQLLQSSSITNGDR